MISQLPITLKDNILFSKVRETDWLASKGAKLFTVNKGSNSFNIINTHLQSDYEEKYDYIRKHQYLEIQKKLIFPYIKKSPLILIGDLNIKSFLVSSEPLSHNMFSPTNAIPFKLNRKKLFCLRF